MKNQGVSEGSMSTDRDDYDFDWATQEFESAHSDQQKRRHQPSFFVGRKGRSVPCELLSVPNSDLQNEKCPYPSSRGIGAFCALVHFLFCFCGVVPNKTSLKSAAVFSSPSDFLKTSVDGPPCSSRPST